MKIDLDYAFKSVMQGRIKKKVGEIMGRSTQRKVKKLRATAKEWKLDVKGWLFKSPSNTDHSGSSEGISTDGPRMRTGQLRRAAGNYKVIPKLNKRDNSYTITVSTGFGQVRSYSTNQKKVWNYSDILDETTGKYYSGYKDRYRGILYKRMEDVIHGNL